MNYNNSSGITEIDRAAFGSGYALYAFDLTPDLGEDDHFSPVSYTHLTLPTIYSV